MLARFAHQTQYIHRALLELLFPPRCVVCRRAGEWFCQRCQSQIVMIEPPICNRCGRPIPHEPCPYCQKIPIQMDGVRALAYFEGNMRQAIHHFKYSHRVELAAVFAAMLDTYLAFHPIPSDVIIPVPLHPDREKSRGYNQARLITHELGARRNLPVLIHSLTRVRATQPQFELNALERRANVREAFHADDRVAGARVLLLDDVCTTGATMDECCIALRQRGAQSVWGLALARGR